MRRYYADESEVDRLVNRINHQQSQKGIFVNIAVKPYRGKKYDPQRTVVVVVG